MWSTIIPKFQTSICLFMGEKAYLDQNRPTHINRFADDQNKRVQLE